MLVRPVTSPSCAAPAAAACRADPAFQEALAKRGIDDASLVWVDPESIAGFEPADLTARRLCWGTVWHRETEDDNGYARPVAGLIPIIDLETLEVLRIEDHGVVPLAAEGGNYRSGTWGPDRTVAPLEIIQPRDRGSRSTASWSPGRTGRFGWASPTARDLCCTTSSTTKATSRARC